MTGSDLKDRITILSLEKGGDGWAWVPGVPTWAKVEYQNHKSLWSAVGIGARGVTFIVRKRPVDLSRAIRWHGHHCHITDIAPVEGAPGFLTVHAALVEPMSCRADADQGKGGVKFPGILTEKYVRHEEPDLHGEVGGCFVLVTPKVVRLEPGSWVEVMGNMFFVGVPHEMDPDKNEYEIKKTGDC